MMSKLWCECLFVLLIFYITLQHSFRRNSFVTKHINLHRYLSHGYSLFPVNHVNLNKKRFGSFHPISSLHRSDIDRGVDVYDLDQSSDSLKSSLNEMIDGIEVAELGLLLMVGPSMVCNGLGLFIACSDDVDSVTIPSSTPICGYSRGIFTEYNIIDSDKTVLYRFTNINQGVLFEKKVIRLIDVIHIMMDRYTINTLDQADSMLLGHIVTVATETDSKDDDNGVIVPDENYKNNYFIPDHYINNNIEDIGSSNDDNSNDMVCNDTDTTSDIIQTIVDDNRDDDDGMHDDDNDGTGTHDDDNDVDAGSDSVVVKAFDINATNIGIFANDLAYDFEEMSSLSQETYYKNANAKNILELLWRLEDRNGCIIPTWPVVMLAKDVLIRNRDYAIEVGLTYSYRYWKSMQRQISSYNQSSS